MKSHGLTLLELLVSTTIFCIILAIGIPSFNKQISDTRTKTATLALLDAIETTRATAVFRNQQVILKATNKKWHEGWTLFIDKNSNDLLDSDDETLLVHSGLDVVLTQAKAPINSYVAFIGTGEGRQIGSKGKGGFLAGTIKICPVTKGEGYSLILSKGGRTRVAKLSLAECDAIR
ncbi:GspH/FimT family pseudopilin [Cellvibrio sp. OA-2007]|uniref:GspH/FimT family pseudopilin n=1 Tax=Cellvibrio sp. OA-2007 TaxID=529823 RepID=UPI0007811F18|nr:GspH/FimT family pseudopilin [Cellvibrio sp. OA-2007]